MCKHRYLHVYIFVEQDTSFPVNNILISFRQVHSPLVEGRIPLGSKKVVLSRLSLTDLDTGPSVCVYSWCSPGNSLKLVRAQWLPVVDFSSPFCVFFTSSILPGRFCSSSPHSLGYNLPVCIPGSLLAWGDVCISSIFREQRAAEILIYRLPLSLSPIPWSHHLHHC